MFGLGVAVDAEVVAVDVGVVGQQICGVDDEQAVLVHGDGVVVGDGGVVDRVDGHADRGGRGLRPVGDGVGEGVGAVEVVVGVVADGAIAVDPQIAVFGLGVTLDGEVVTVGVGVVGQQVRRLDDQQAVLVDRHAVVAGHRRPVRRGDDDRHEREFPMPAEQTVEMEVVAVVIGNPDQEPVSAAGERELVVGVVGERPGGLIDRDGAVLGSEPLAARHPVRQGIVVGVGAAERDRNTDVVVLVQRDVDLLVVQDGPSVEQCPARFPARGAQQRPHSGAGRRIGRRRTNRLGRLVQLDGGFRVVRGLYRGCGHHCRRGDDLSCRSRCADARRRGRLCRLFDGGGCVGPLDGGLFAGVLCGRTCRFVRLRRRGTAVAARRRILRLRGVSVHRGAVLLGGLLLAAGRRGVRRRCIRSRHRLVVRGRTARRRVLVGPGDAGRATGHRKPDSQCHS